MALLLAAGCGGAGRHPGRGGRDTTLFRRLEGEPATLNPILRTSSTEGSVLAGVARNLIDFDQHLQPIGGLCDRWEIAPDLRTFTFHLRPKIVWEDGSAVTAQDAVATIRRIADPKVPAVLFASGLEGLTGVEALDARTFRVRFARPYAFRIDEFNFPILPAAEAEELGTPSGLGRRTPPSNGPYRLTEWKSGESITLTRNPRYQGEAAAFERVVFRILPDQRQAYQALLRGELDETRLSFEQAREAGRDPSYQRCCRTLLFYDLSFFFLGYNNRLPEFRDPLTRRALTMLIDRQEIVDRLYGGAGRILSGPWPADMAAYDAAVRPYPFDPAQARRLLAEAGWQATGRGLARDGAPFRFTLLYAASSNSSRQVAELSAEAFRGAGIDCRLLPVEWASLTRRMDAGDFDAVLASWENDVNPDLYPGWHSSQSPPRGMNNLSYRSPEADSLMEEIRAEADERKRLALLHALHRVLHEDEPATWILQAAQRFGISRRLNGVETSPLGLFRFWPGANAWTPGGN